MGANSRERTEPLKGAKTLIPYFRGFGADAQLLGGAELEIFLMRRARDGFARVSDYENFKLFEAIKRGDNDPESDVPSTPISHEPEASQIETLSRPHRLSEIHFVADEIAAHSATILRCARDITVSDTEIEHLENLITANASELRPPSEPLYKGNLVASPFAVMPFGPAEDALRNVISPRGHGEDYSDRPRLMVQSFSRAMSREATLYPVSNVAVHFTHGAHSLRHAFEMSRVQAALLPFFFILTENRPPYMHDRPERVMHHTGLRARLALNTLTHENHQRRGLLPDFLFAARDENDFVARLIDRVMNAPMLAYYNHAGRFTPVAPGEKLSPMAMQGKGPQNVAQFELAMSEFWWSFKYKLPRGNRAGLFHELRDFDSGPEVVNNIALIGGMLSLNDAARADMIRRLERRYGIPVMSDPETARKVIRHNMRGVYHRGNPAIHTDAGTEHMQIPFGARGHTMLDFLRTDLLPMLEQQYKGSAAASRLQNLRFVAQAGLTNTQMWHNTITGPDQMRRALHELTAPGAGYNRLVGQCKSWAEHYDDGNLPMFRPKSP
jgi:hypothetical protein